MTEEQQKELEIQLTCYMLEKHTQDECAGFIDGFKKALSLFAVSGSFCIKHGCKKECIECENDTFPMERQNDH